MSQALMELTNVGLKDAASPLFALIDVDQSGTVEKQEVIVSSGMFVCRLFGYLNLCLCIISYIQLSGAGNISCVSTFVSTV